MADEVSRTTDQARGPDQYASPLAVAVDRFLTRRKVNAGTDDGMKELAAFVSGWNAALDAVGKSR